MGLSAAGFGFLLSAFAAGSVLASPLVARIQRRLGTTTSLLVALTLFPLSMVMPALTAEVWPIVGAFFVSGAVNVVWNVITVSLRQRIVPDRLLGRVNAGYRLLAWGTMPVGAALGGVLGETIGVTGVFWVAAGLSALCLPLLLSEVSDDAIAAAEAASDHEAVPALP
jgi:predicted MFS family arabinose efflux permease